MPTIFSKIIEGQIPCYKIFEDELTFAFLDNSPHTTGHTLLVPKVEVGHWLDLSEPYYNQILVNAKTIAKAIQQATECEKVGLVVNGMGVKDHFHLHLIPLFKASDTDGTNAKPLETEEAVEIQKKILEALQVEI